MIILQISEMVSDKQEEVTALEMKLQVLDKDLNWKKEVSNSWFTVNEGIKQPLAIRNVYDNWKIESLINSGQNGCDSTGGTSEHCYIASSWFVLLIQEPEW